MGVADPLRLSIGEWASVCRIWAKAHDGQKADPPSDDEFEAAVTAVRGTR